jgi:putative transposase
MKKTRFTETQMVKPIKDHENIRMTEDICRELGLGTNSV